MKKPSKKGTRAERISRALEGMPRTDAVSEPPVQALTREIDRLKSLLEQNPESAELAAAIQQTRLEILSIAKELLPLARRNARRGKPALLRLLHRIAR